jgi:hypothetical protein
MVCRHAQAPAGHRVEVSELNHEQQWAVGQLTGARGRRIDRLVRYCGAGRRSFFLAAVASPDGGASVRARRPAGHVAGSVATVIGLPPSPGPARQLNLLL